MPNGTQQRDLERGEMLVAEFTDRFGDAHRALAEHAALPLVLTPELVNYLHGEFLRRELPHYEATADLLLSELCREIGYEQYAMDRDARAFLLAKMQERGDDAVQAVAGKLLGYVGYLARTRRAYQRQELKNQQWAAMVYLDEARDAAVEQLVERINQCLLAGDGSSGGATSRAELARLARLVEEFAPQLQQYPEFVERAQMIGRLLADASGAVAAEATRDQTLTQRITVAGVEMAGLRSLLRLREKSMEKAAEGVVSLVAGEVVKGFIDLDPIQPRLFETMAIPVRVVVNLGKAGKGIAPVTDFLFRGRPYANATQFETFKPLVDLEFDFVVTHPEDSEGFYGVAKITRFSTSSWQQLEDVAEEKEPAIGRLIELSPHPVVALGPFRARLGDDVPERLLEHEVPVLINKWDGESQEVQALFRDAIEIEARRRRRRSIAELVKDCVVEGRVKLTLDKESYAIDLGGVIGKLPHNEMSWQLEDAQTVAVLKTNERILVKVLEIDRQQETVRLSRKQLLPEQSVIATTVELPIEVSQLLAELQQQQRALLAQVWRITETQREINALDAQSGEEWERLYRRRIEETREREAIGERIAQLVVELHRRQTTPPPTVESFLIQTAMTDQERFGEQSYELWQRVNEYLRAGESDDQESEVRALAEIARVFSTIPELPPAITLYRFAEERATERMRLEYNLYDRIASCHERLGNLADAETFHRQALELATAQNAPAKQMHANRALADIYQKTEQFDDALNHLNNALAFAGDFEDNGEQVSILTQIATVHLERNDNQALIETLQSALEIAGGLEDKDEEARVRIRLGEAFLDTQEYRKAIEQYGLASEISQDPYTQMAAYSGLAHAQFRQGHWGEADTFFARALEIAEAQGDEVWIATTLEMLGLTHLEMEDYQGSLGYYERALRIHQQRKDRPQLAATLSRMGRVHTASNDAQNAFDCYRQAALLFAELGERSDEAAMGEACAHAMESLGDRDDAIEFAEGALALFEQINPEDAGRVRAFLDRLRTTTPRVSSLEAARKIADPDRRSMALRDAAVQLFEAGEIEKSKAAFDEAIASAKQIKGWIRRLAAQRQINAARNQSGVDEPQSFASTFSFETVTLDETGREMDRRRLTASQFIEDLGNGVTLELVSIPGGTFLMGAPASEEGSYDDERPQHKVTVRPFLIGKFTITQRQWRAIAEDKSLKVGHDVDPNPSRFKGDNRPVEQISWRDAKEFCARLSEKTGHPYRLPTEAEWEYACRAGTTTPFAFGETITPAIMNYNGNYPYAKAAKGAYREETIPVNSLGVANAFGLYDMHGNVWEWCEDSWHSNYQGAPSDSSAWLSGGDSSRRVLRGGSWGNLSIYCRSASRSNLSPDDRDLNISVRVVVARVP